MTHARLSLALLLACPFGQACTPLVFEVASAADSHGHPITLDSEPDPGTTHQPTGGGPEPGDTDGDTCHNGERDGGETDVDCGGPCPPCEAGLRCEGPGDCLFDACIDGLCGPPRCQSGGCPPLGQCLDQICLPTGECVPQPVDDGQPCDDGDLCTLKDSCLAGKCVPAAVLDCSEFTDQCRTGTCNPVTGHCAVEWIDEGMPCEDGLDCTLGETCSAGECTPGKPPLPFLLFTDFSLAGGWLAEPPWQIGPALASACGQQKADDPAADHSPTADDHLAGAAIGDCLPQGPFPDACLVSPPIDITGFPGPIELRYWGLLNSAGGPMESHIDVFDGRKQSWFPIVSIPQFVAEGGWTEHVHDIGLFKSDELRVRFCHRADGPTEPVGGWSIDDLSIGPPGCG